MIPTPYAIWTTPDSPLMFVEILAGNKYVVALYDSRNGMVWEVQV